MGYKGSTSLSSGFVYAPYPPTGWGDMSDYKELIDLVFFHVREALPKEVLPASYKVSDSYVAGWMRPCIHLTMDKCRTLIIFPLSDNRVTFFRADFSSERRAYKDMLKIEDPSFFEELDKIILKWFRAEQERWFETKREIDKSRRTKKKEPKPEPLPRSWRQVRGQPRRKVKK
jgi:hypothetical protein